jgi:hypothetical protein
MVGSGMGYCILGCRVSSKRFKKDRTSHLCSTTTTYIRNTTTLSQTNDPF